MEDTGNYKIKNIISSSHINFLFEAGVNGRAFPQLNGFKDTIKLLSSFVGQDIQDFEGAIPYVMSKPKQILPALCIGAGVTGALIPIFGVTLSAPIGGLETLPLVSNIPMYLLAFVIGTAVAVAIIWLLTRNQPDEEE